MVIKGDVVYTPNGEYRTLHIYLPDDYYESDERYPVMYYFDGHNLFSNEDATFGTSWGLQEFMRDWNKKMIIVGIECSHKGRERLSEYSPYYFKSEHLGEVKGTGMATMQWIIDEVKPMIDEEFRTYRHREATGIAGSSMGGLMALYGVIACNTVFSKAACLSSAIYSCDSLLHTEISAHHLNPDTRIYMGWGEHEAYMRNNSEFLGNHLKDSGVKVRMYEQPGGEHNEASWRQQNPNYMYFLWMEG